MKTFKISLALIVFGAIVYFIYSSIGGIGKPDPITSSDNLFIKRIKEKTISLSKLPDNKFCNDVYKEISYLIDTDAEEGHFGKSQTENKEWQDIFNKNLYSAYAPKFIKQAYAVFNGNAWNLNDISILRSEVAKLRASVLLENGSPIANKFTEIQTILNKYDEINNFINTCNRTSYTGTGFLDRFPINQVQALIGQSRAHLASNRGNLYVNKCTRLHTSLKELPKMFFRKHVSYLSEKINTSTGMYKEFASHKDYVNNFYNPIKIEIDGLENNIYGENGTERQRLLNLWSEDNLKAYSHKYN